MTRPRPRSSPRPRPSPPRPRPSSRGTARSSRWSRRSSRGTTGWRSGSGAGWPGRGVLALNLVSSPGAGKTTLLERTIRDLGGEMPLSVIEGDQQTLNDARRIQAAGCRVVQINTGTACHLDASMIARALQQLDPPARLGRDDRERRQPGLPGALRPRRVGQGGDRLGDRGGRQADQVSAHVPRERADGPEQDRPAPPRPVRRGSLHRLRPPGQPADRRPAGLRDAGRRPGRVV